MPLLRDWIESIFPKTIETMIDDAVSERVAKIEENLPFFSESGYREIPVLKSSDYLRKGGRKSTRLINHVMEQKQGGIRRSTSNGYTIIKSPYQYDRIDSFFAKESYFARSVTRQIETMLRSGVDLISDDREAVGVINRDLNRIQMEMMMSFQQMIWRWVYDLQAYGAVILQKVRKRKGDPTGGDSERLNRIVRLRMIPMINAMIYLSGEGNILSVLDLSPGIVSSNLSNRAPRAGGIPGIPVQDICFAQMYDGGDNLFPIPPCYQMLDDVLTLRSIEETVELLCFQFGSPLLHAQVGTTEEPASPAEVAQVNNNLAAMAPNGMVTTDHRVKIDVINIQKAFANLMPFIQHFKNRVIIGSGTSPVSVGEGDTANRATSESIDDALADHCNYLANIICSIFNYNIIPDILSTYGYKSEDMFDEDGDLLVKMRINEMRQEKRIATENAILNKWNSNVITHEEARRELSYKPLDKSEEAGLQVNKVTIPLAQAKGAVQGGEGGSASYTRTQSQPTNQHGTKAGPGSRKN